MTLGQRIGQYRKALGISQEALGGRLGVSRQAVSKWETDAAAPDMENLLALAREFGVSVAELTATPEEAPPGRHRSWLLPAACGVLALAVLAGALAWSHQNAPGDGGETPSEPSHTEGSPPVSVPDTDFALMWDGPGEKDWLALGVQEDFFPFGTDLVLTEPEEVFDTDYHKTTLHHADCGALLLEYLHIEADPKLDPDSAERESITAVSTIVPGCMTPRSIGVGSTKAEVTAAYGDDLVYCLKEEGSYTLVRHDYYYAYQTMVTFGDSLQFFMRDGLVAGIRLENMGDAGCMAFTPNNLSRFPLVNGEPDFSCRQEPEYEDKGDTWRAYFAFSQLMMPSNNLSAQEEYAYRREIFSLLEVMDWAEYDQLAADSTDLNRPSLLNWLSSREAYSDDELLWLQKGCVNAEGADPGSYANVLALAFLSAPVSFAESLADPTLPEDTADRAVALTAQGTAWYASVVPDAVTAVRDALGQGLLSGDTARWAVQLADAATQSVVP